MYRYRKLCTIARKPGSGRPSKITDYVRSVVEHQMRCDDETTATQLHERLIQYGIFLSLRTVLRSRELLGWTYRGSAYCQLIRDINKQKWLEWALQNQNNRFENVIFSRGNYCSRTSANFRSIVARGRAFPFSHRQNGRPNTACLYQQQPSLSKESKASSRSVNL